MKIYYEYDGLESFEAWSGATDTKNNILNAGKGKEFDALLEDVFCDSATETEINDFLWFDSEEIYKNLEMTEEQGEEENE